MMIKDAIWIINLLHLLTNLRKKKPFSLKLKVAEQSTLMNWSGKIRENSKHGKLNEIDECQLKLELFFQTCSPTDNYSMPGEFLCINNSDEDIDKTFIVRNVPFDVIWSHFYRKSSFVPTTEWMRFPFFWTSYLFEFSISNICRKWYFSIDLGAFCSN